MNKISSNLQTLVALSTPSIEEGQCVITQSEDPPKQTAFFSSETEDVHNPQEKKPLLLEGLRFTSSVADEHLLISFTLLTHGVSTLLLLWFTTKILRCLLL